MTFAGFQKPGEHLLARTYRLEDDAVAVMMITEWFLVGLEPFLKTR
jgi:chorismate-pyruvate lyase